MTSQIDVNSLTAAEKILLAQELWDSVRSDIVTLPVSQTVETELRRRLALSAAGAMKYYSWEEVKMHLRDPLPPKE